MNILKTLFISMLAVLCVSCAQDISPNDYAAANVGTVSRVTPGVILSMRNVKVTGNSGMGTVAGGVAGAVAGSSLGGGARASILGGVGGAVVGGLVGNAIDKGMHHQSGIEYVVRLKGNKFISVVQGPSRNLFVGQHVLLIYGARSRIIPDGAFRKKRA